MPHPSATRRLHLICGTHWDREWRYTYEQSLIRLVEVLDTTTDILERHEDFRSYHLDGGVVMLEDYARVRPDQVECLKRLIRAGRLVLSPWYTLPEMFSVAGESTVRNMLYGHRVGESFGGVRKVGYTATGYGQLSQLPQLYAGFGIDTILFYRGLNKYVAPALFWWEGADGTRALDFRLFDDFTRSNFYFRVYRRLVLDRRPEEGRHGGQPGRLFHPAGEATYEDEYRVLDPAPCPYTDEALRAAVDDLSRDAARLEVVPGQFLAMHEEDNARPSETLLALIADIRRSCPDTEVRVESLAEYIDFVRHSLGPERLAALPVLKGEMRHCDVDGFWGGLFASAISARIDLKAANEAAEHALIRRAEPLTTFAWALGSEKGPRPFSERFPYPAERLEAAWKALLENHAHDSINGTSMDQVHQDMAYRFDKARLIGEELTTRALAHLTAWMIHPEAKPGEFLVAVVNASGWERTGPVTCVIDLPADGPTERFELVAPDGTAADCQVEPVGAVRGRVHNDLAPGLRFFAERFRVTFQAERLPAFGWRTYRLRPFASPASFSSGRRDLRTQRTGPAAMENEFLRVEVHSNGACDLTHKPTGRRYEGLHVFEDGGDVGHATTFCAPPGDEIVTSAGGAARVTFEEDGALRTTLRAELTMSVPAELELDGSARGRQRVLLPITSRLTLRKGVPYLDIATEIENRAFGHRLRVLFPTGLARATASTAAVPFDVVRRPITPPDSSNWKEPYYPTHPADAFVDVQDGALGFAVFLRGLKEYEVTDTADRRLAITLLRAPREGMAVHAPQTRAETHRHAGRHCLGRHVLRYALAPHAGDWRRAGLFRLADHWRSAPEVVQFQMPEKGSDAFSAAEFTFLRIEPVDLVLSAVKKAEDRKSVIVRLWNPTAEPLDAALTVGLPIREAHLVRLDEMRQEALPLEGEHGVRFAAGPKKILTVELVPSFQWAAPTL